MPVPTAYTEDQLKTLMVADLATVGTVLGWTTATTQVGEALYDALFLYGGSTGVVIAEATEIPKLRACARLAIWRAAVKATAGHFDFTADTLSYSRSQVQKMAKDGLAIAEREALVYGVDPSYVVAVDTLRVPDPYTYWPDEVLEQFV